MNKKLILIITIIVVVSSFTTFALTSVYHPCEWYFWRDYDRDTLEEDYYDPECGMYDLIFKKYPGEDIFSGEIILDGYIDE